MTCWWKILKTLKLKINTVILSYVRHWPLCTDELTPRWFNLWNWNLRLILPLPLQL